MDGVLVRQTWGTHYIDFLYDESGTPYSLVYDGVQYYYVKNVQGDVVQIRSVYGTLLVEYTYDAWGNVLSITGSNASVLGANNPIRYRSYYYDFETGFYYLQSRYYDPAMRRFINADDVSLLGANSDFASLNLYAYCGNNPVSRADDGGEFWHIVAGAVIGGVSSFVSAKLSGESTKNALVSMAFGAVSGGLCAALPAASAAIGATMGAAESLTLGVMNGDSAGKIASDMMVSAVLGAATSEPGFFTSKSTYKEAGEILKSLKKLAPGNNPTVKKNVKKAAVKFAKKVKKNLISEFLEDTSFNLVDYGFGEFNDLCFNNK